MTMALNILVLCAMREFLNNIVVRKVELIGFHVINQDKQDTNIQYVEPPFIKTAAAYVSTNF